MEYNSHIAWRTQIPGMILVIVLVLLSAALSAETANGSWFWVATASVAAFVVLKHYYYTYRIHDGKIERQKGLIARDVHSVRITDLRNTNLNQGVVGRVLNFGDVEFSTSGGGGIEVRFRNIPRPKWLKEQVEERLDNEQ